MILFNFENTPAPARRGPIPRSDLDFALTAQIIVAWAGEKGEEDPRLGWWPTDLVSEFGGRDLFQRLLPNTWQWATLVAVREAARRKDQALRAQAHDPDRIVSLYHFGFDVDERIDERFRDLRATVPQPSTALPDLSFIDEGWNRTRFREWTEGHKAAEFSGTSIGRQLVGEIPGTLQGRAQKLVAALSPLADQYPLPHFRRPR
ncbi:MAG: BREX-6 system BrxE protein [Myxococcales bacterium]|nr:BREX-6 system BrxE protein [Myxococcales bacterium]